MKSKRGTTVRELRKKPGVCYAFTEDGIELPVVDITNPAFSMAITEKELDSQLTEFLRKHQKQSAFQGFVMKKVVTVFMNRSMLGRSLMGAQNGFLGGMETYVMKLGAENLGSGYANRVDRSIAAAPASLAMRMRLENMSRMTAESIIAAISSQPQRPLYIIDIAGGPAADVMNALILVRRNNPGLLSGRKVIIHVLDLEQGGASFGARSLDALQTEDAPLHGISVEFRFDRYDWSDASRLPAIVGSVMPPGAAVVAASEGGLFEYGSDEIITSNLLALAELVPKDTNFIGSVVRSDGPSAALRNTLFKIPTIDRTLDQMNVLATCAGWATARSKELLFCRVLQLTRK